MHHQHSIGNNNFQHFEHEFSELGVMAPQCFQVGRIEGWEIGKMQCNQHSANNHQIMGFDILVKRDGTPVLLEVNSCPSLSVDHNLTPNEVHDAPTFMQSQQPGFGTDDLSSLPVRSIVDEVGEGECGTK